MAVSLRLLAQQHVDDIAGLLDDRDVLRFTRLPVPPPPGYAREWLDRYEAGRADGTREAFAAVDDDGRFLGLALAVEIDREGRQVELGPRPEPGQPSCPGTQQETFHGPPARAIFPLTLRSRRR